MNPVIADLLAHQHARAVLRDRHATLLERDAARTTLGLAPLPCGTRSRYVQGCRCDHCTRENTLYNRRYRGNWNERLPVECWCHDTIIGVPPADLLAGLTRSCGKRECKP